jgi:hypothetical protein
VPVYATYRTFSPGKIGLVAVGEDNRLLINEGGGGCGSGDDGDCGGGGECGGDDEALLEDEALLDELLTGNVGGGDTGGGCGGGDDGDSGGGEDANE